MFLRGTVVKLWIPFLLLVNANVYASDSIYLHCKGEVFDTALNQEVKKVNNDFLINKKDKYVQQIITGLTEEQTKDLRHPYEVTKTQYVTSDGFLSINRHTLEYEVDGVMGIRIRGVCKVLAPEI